MTIALTGIKEKIYLGSWNLDVSPSVLQPKVEDAKTALRLADGTYTVSYAVFYSGCPSKPTKYSWQLKWDKVTSDDVVRINRLISRRASFDFCYWQPVVESFWKEVGDTTDRYVQRRNALDVISSGLLPANAATVYEPKLWVNDTETDATLTTINTTWYRQKVTGLSDSNHNDVLYYPVFRVKVADGQQQFELPVKSSWTLNLVEV